MSPLYSLRFLSIFGSGDLALVTLHGVVSGTVLFDSPISSSPLQVAAEVPVPADGPAALVVGALALLALGVPALPLPEGPAQAVGPAALVVGAFARLALGVPALPLTLEPVAKQRPEAPLPGSLPSATAPDSRRNLFPCSSTGRPRQDWAVDGSSALGLPEGFAAFFFVIALLPFRRSNLSLLRLRFRSRFPWL